MATITRRMLNRTTLAGLVAGPANAEQAVPIAAAPANVAPTDADQQDFLLTVFLRHDENKTLAEINEHLKQTGFFKQFPPDGIEVMSWYVMMGIGQVVTLKVPPSRLREVNRVLEQTAWGGFRTEFYPTYDYRQGAAETRAQMR